MNVFYCNGIIPVLLSGALIKNKYSKNQNVLIIELSETKQLFTSFAATSSHEMEVLELVVECSQWDKVNRISFVYKLLEFNYLPFPFSYSPISSLRSLVNKKKVLMNLKKILNNLPKSSKLIISDNSVLAKYFVKDYPDTCFMEHGASSYRPRLKNKNWKYFIKEVLSKLTGVSFNLKINSVYLSDNKQSARSTDFFKNGQGIIPLSHDLSKEIKDIYSKFILKLKQRHPLAFQELSELKLRYENDNLYFYLPTGVIPHDEYEEYLGEQLKLIPDESAIFIVKPHGDDTTRDYCSYFNTLGQKSQVFNNKINTFIPIEFLILFFEGSTLLSSYSTAHLYVKWWLNQKTIFAEVKSSPKNEMLMTEYRSVYNDLQNL